MSTTKKTIDSYNKFAQDYTNYLNDSSNFWNAYLEAPALISILKPLVSNKKVLDLGCGSGISSKKLIDINAKVVGIDISEEMIKIAKKSIANANFYVGNIENLPFNNQEFDVVSSSLALHYIEDLYPVFCEVSRVLKKGGSFVFSIHHPFFNCRKKVIIDGETNYVFTSYFTKHKYEWSMLSGEMTLDSYHHTFAEIANNLIKAKFNITQVVETTPIPEGEKISPEDYKKTMEYPSFIIFKAQKC